MTRRHTGSFSSFSSSDGFIVDLTGEIEITEKMAASTCQSGGCKIVFGKYKK